MRGLRTILLLVTLVGLSSAGLVGAFAPDPGRAGVLDAVATAPGLSAAEREAVASALSIYDLVSAEDPAGAIRAAQARTLKIAESLGGADGEIAIPSHASVSEAVLSFLAGHGYVPTADELASIRALDQTDATLAAALTRVVDVFAAFQESQRAAVMEDENFARTLRLRNDLLDAVHALEEAYVPGVQATTVSIGPFVGIGLTGSDTHVQNYMLLVDLDGSDTYLNNAGGSWIGDCGDLSTYAAAAIDLGTFDSDSFNTHWNVDACGKNGGAYNGGAGFLYNSGGSAQYGGWGGSWDFSFGTNGGAYGAGSLGFLLDNSLGSVTVGGGHHGVNGGGDNGGVGMLVSGSTQTALHGYDDGVNGGGANLGVGNLIAAGARLRAWSQGTNGGGYYGVGYAVTSSFDVDGGSYGSNGGAYGDGGAGFFLEAGGNTRYDAGSFGANGGGYTGGVGQLHDLVGDFDEYHGGQIGVNGGATGGAGLLYDYLGAGDHFHDAYYDCTNAPTCTFFFKESVTGYLLDNF